MPRQSDALTHFVLLINKQWYFVTIKTTKIFHSPSCQKCNGKMYVFIFVALIVQSCLGTHIVLNEPTYEVCINQWNWQDLTRALTKNSANVETLWSETNLLGWSANSCPTNPVKQGHSHYRILNKLCINLIASFQLLNLDPDK